MNEGERTVIPEGEGPVSLGVSRKMTPMDDEPVLGFNQVRVHLGHLSGKVAAFDDRLISVCSSGDHSLEGCKALLRMGKNCYAVTGTLVGNGNIVNLRKPDLVRLLSGDADNRDNDD